MLSDYFGNIITIWYHSHCYNYNKNLSACATLRFSSKFITFWLFRTLHLLTNLVIIVHFFKKMPGVVDVKGSCWKQKMYFHTKNTNIGCGFHNYWPLWPIKWRLLLRMLHFVNILLMKQVLSTEIISWSKKKKSSRWYKFNFLNNPIRKNFT